jgi:hypothetical protein
MTDMLGQIILGVVVVGVALVMAYVWFLRKSEAKADINKIPVLVKNLTNSFPAYASEFNIDSAKAVYVAYERREADIEQAPDTTDDWPVASYFEDIFSPALVDHLHTDKRARNTLLADIINARHEANGAPLRFVLDENNDLRFNTSIKKLGK